MRASLVMHSLLRAPILHRCRSLAPQAPRPAKATGMSTIVKTARAEDFLAVVPRLVGFAPKNSIVLVVFRGRRTCGAVRFDLPQPTVPEPTVPEPTVQNKRVPDDSNSKFYRRVATTVVGTLSKIPGVDAVVPVVYTGEAFADSGGIPRGVFVAAVMDRLRYSGFRVRDALCVASDAWGSYLDESCPATGRPLAAITDSPVLGDLPADDYEHAGAVEQQAALPTVTLFQAERVARLVRRFAELIDHETSADDSAARHAQIFRAIGLPTFRDSGEVSEMLDTPAAIEAILRHEPADLDPVVAAFVIATVRSPAMRDVIMLQWAFDLDTGVRVLRDARRFALGTPADELDSAVLMLGEGPRPRPERVLSAISTLKTITAMAPRASRPPLFCMLAWLNWALGRSSLAHLFVSAAEDIDANYGLAEVMRAVLDRGMLPEWAFADDR